MKCLEVIRNLPDRTTDGTDFTERGGHRTRSICAACPQSSAKLFVKTRPKPPKSPLPLVLPYEKRGLRSKLLGFSVSNRENVQFLLPIGFEFLSVSGSHSLLHSYANSLWIGSYGEDKNWTIVLHAPHVANCLIKHPI